MLLGGQLKPFGVFSFISTVLSIFYYFVLFCFFLEITIISECVHYIIFIVFVCCVFRLKDESGNRERELERPIPGLDKDWDLIKGVHFNLNILYQKKIELILFVTSRR